MTWFNSKRRGWIYGIIAAALPIAGLYTGMDAATQGQWLNLAAAILMVGAGAGAGLARANLTHDDE